MLVSLLFPLWTSFIVVTTRIFKLVVLPDSINKDRQDEDSRENNIKKIIDDIFLWIVAVVITKVRGTKKKFVKLLDRENQFRTFKCKCADL